MKTARTPFQPEDWDKCAPGHCPLGYDRRVIERVYVNGLLTLGARAVLSRGERGTVVELTLPDTRGSVPNNRRD